MIKYIVALLALIVLNRDKRACALQPLLLLPSLLATLEGSMSLWLLIAHLTQLNNDLEPQSVIHRWADEYTTCCKENTALAQLILILIGHSNILSVRYHVRMHF